MKKSFLISVDTEGDGLWWWKPGDPISTENTKFLPRFQQLCDRFGFKPTYLTNWEMANNAFYADFAKRVVNEGHGEVGMHLHAWNTPPICNTMRPKLADLGQDYLIEYDETAMEEKIVSTTKAIESSVGVRPTTHRAGRWAMDDRYFKLLAKHGYRCDCSVTPLIDWSSCIGSSEGSAGSDYTNYSAEPKRFTFADSSSIVELPLTTSASGFVMPDRLTPRLLGRELKRLVNKRPIQCRPTGTNVGQMLRVARQCFAQKDGYLMFMIHSSELMPGGSPSFPDEQSIENLYRSLEAFFEAISDDYVGMTIGDYAASLDI